MKGYKAFNKGFVCRGKQYAENTVFEEEEAEICKSGMHFCENPLDVLDYYPLIDKSGDIVEVADVEALDECKTNDNKKYCTKKLKIGVKLSLAAFVKAAIDFAFEKNDGKASTGHNAQLASSDDYAKQLASSGDYAKLASSGDYAQFASSGDYAKLASSGYNAQLASSGDYAQFASSGYNAQLASSGDYAQFASSGYNAQLASSGNYAQLASSGNYAQLASSGDYSVIAAIGFENCAKGKKGNWITLAEWVKDEKTGKYKPICVKTERIDGERIKENVFYKLVGGEFTEVKND